MCSRFLYFEKFPSEERRGDKVSSCVYDVTCNLLETRQTCLKLIHGSVYISYIHGVPGGMCQTSGECSLS